MLQLKSTKNSFKTFFTYIYWLSKFHVSLHGKFFFLTPEYIFIKFYQFRYFRILKRFSFLVRQLKATQVWPFRRDKFFVTSTAPARKWIYVGINRIFYRRRPKKRISNLKAFPQRHIGVKKGFNLLKYINFYKLSLRLKLRKPYFSLKNRIFLNKKLIQKSLISFFYKKIKFKATKKEFQNTIYRNNLTYPYKRKLFNIVQYVKRKKVVFLNCYKKFYWKMRKSRITHWNGLVGNRLNKYRYVKFINKTMKNLKWESPNSFFTLLIAHLGGVLCSWKQIYLLITYQLIIVNGKFYMNKELLKQGDIIEICYGRGLYINFNIRSYLNLKIIYRLKRWGYKIKLNYQRPRRKRIFHRLPKSINSLMLMYKGHGRSFMYLRSLGLVAIIYPIKELLYEPNRLAYETTILKLNNWRYKF